MSVNLERPYFIFGIFLFVSNFIVIALSITGNDIYQTKESITLRGVALCLSIPLLLKTHWPKFLNKYSAIYWYICICFSISFLGLYTTLLNKGDIYWLFNCFVGLVWSFILLEKLEVIFVFFIGSIAALIIYKIFHGQIIWITPLHYTVAAIISYIWTIIFLSLFLTGKREIMEKITKEKINTIYTLSKAIAHDVNAPLSANNMGLELIEKGLKVGNKEGIMNYINKMKQYNNQSIQDINIMLSSININDNYKPDDWGDYFIIDCINNAIAAYDMIKLQKSDIYFLDKDNIHKDFKFLGSPTLLQHIISNLINNSFKYAGNNVKIEIFLNKENREVHIKDNGNGIKPEILKNLFSDYQTSYSTKVSGHGIGLSFCKKAMGIMNGDIKCYSNENKGTEFILSFFKKFYINNISTYYIFL